MARIAAYFVKFRQSWRGCWYTIVTASQIIDTIAMDLVALVTYVLIRGLTLILYLAF
ncbi:hypothetical protein SAMN06296036_115148 [Pseudobacteriovorax antillogorgiicola]|uniref:Uncharacterized protein n=1 Tax=Pseudobacteriovorax antillogorgiicola TaxID=1513793 RepID=A0A1Y6C834_9BACT|nr:hypothetical protein EDD56_110179 [Pseudobacteriovorax antillogorgiicola]SMF50036.1 hypothetical protein SAMN06296036_115148 [Pseudobacteriovorax antillogorgiicola]